MTGTAGRKIAGRPEVIGVGVLAVHSVALHLAAPGPGAAALNLMTAAGLCGLALRAGCTPAELGLDRRDARGGLRAGLAGAVVAGAVVGLAAAAPPTRRLFDDDRVTGMGGGELAYHVVVRIPLVTALSEEVMFRGALLALLRRRQSRAAAVAWTSLLFGAWHILPTLEHHKGNRLGAVGAGPAAAVTTIATTAAGGVLAWLRLRSGSVLAPALAHAAVNDGALLAARWAAGRTPAARAARTRTMPARWADPSERPDTKW
jgi:membrane protease YdiL (CAAX protease family)